MEYERNLIMKQLKLPDVGDHILLKIESQFSHEVILTSLDDDEYCAINLENGKGIRDENDDLICSDSIPELLGELQKYSNVYLMED